MKARTKTVATTPEQARVALLTFGLVEADIDLDDCGWNFARPFGGPSNGRWGHYPSVVQDAIDLYEARVGMMPTRFKCHDGYYVMDSLTAKPEAAKCCSECGREL